jgi:uncharacterized membrane protein
MAKKKSVPLASKRTKAGSASAFHWSMPFGKTNFIYFGIALGVVLLGYALMATGITSDPQKYLETWANPVAIVVAPTVLVIAYCVLIPLAIMKRETHAE